MARKKSIAERLGLVERVGTEPEESYALDADYDVPEEEERIDVEGVNADAVDFIGQLYHNNGIDDFSRSIFKAEEILSTLPNTLLSEVRRTTTAGILNSFGIDVNEILVDAKNREGIINEVCRQTCQAEQEAEDQLLKEIEELRATITEKQQQVQGHQQKRSEVSDICEKEVKRISGLVAFLGPLATKETSEV